MRRYTLTNPHPEHYPRVGRKSIGLTSIQPQRPLYGTTLRCSCGWRPKSFSGAKVSNRAPSKGGRVDALKQYREHLLDVLAVADMDADLYEKYLAKAMA